MLGVRQVGAGRDVGRAIGEDDGVVVVVEADIYGTQGQVPPELADHRVVE